MNTMAMRSFIIAGLLVIVFSAVLAVLWVTSDGAGSSSRGSDRISASDFDDDGSLRDEFGSSSGQVVIRTGDAVSRNWTSPSSGSRGFGSGPQFAPQGSGGVWSGGSSNTANLPRETAPERVEADCRNRGRGAFACRCIVNRARRILSEEEFEFFSLAEEQKPDEERLAMSGLGLEDLVPFSSKLVFLDAEATRSCGAGLTR